MPWMFLAAVVFVAIATIFFFLFRALLSPPTTEINPDRIRDFSLARYTPLLRALQEDDYIFLRSLKSFEPAIERTLRTERRIAISGYLRSLSRDFEMLHKSARLMLTHGAVNRPDLATALIRQSITFRYALMVVRIRVAWNHVGLPKLSVDLNKILGPAGWLDAELRTLSIASAQQA